MIILIDGYNLLRNIFPKAKGFLDQQRKQLIILLGLYKIKKKETVNEIIIVFDGGTFGHASREVKNGIVIIFSGQKSSADDWIIEYAKKKAGSSMILISLDRQLIQTCEQYQVNSMDVFSFYNIIQDVIVDDNQNQQTSLASSTIKKYEPYDDHEDFPATINQQTLDILMETASTNATAKESSLDSKITDRKKTTIATKKLSKQEKKLYHKVKKLR